MRTWTEELNQLIRENSPIMTDSKLALALSEKAGRTITVQAARKQRQKLGIQKQPGRGITKIVKEDESHLADAAAKLNYPSITLYNFGQTISDPTTGDFTLVDIEICKIFNDQLLELPMGT